MLNLEEEKKLVERAKKDPEAFGELYDEYYSRIFGYVLKRVADIEIAQDIVSETFFKAIKNIWRFRWQNIPFSSWLYRIASNEIANYFRKEKYKTISLEDAPEPVYGSTPFSEIMEAQEELEKHKDFLSLQEKISKLSIRHQEVITLKFFEKRQIKEIADILGKKEGTVKSLLHRALEKLREQMDANN